MSAHECIICGQGGHSKKGGSPGEWLCYDFIPQDSKSSQYYVICRDCNDMVMKFSLVKICKELRHSISADPNEFNRDASRPLHVKIRTLLERQSIYLFHDIFFVCHHEDTINLLKNRLVAFQNFGTYTDGLRATLNAVEGWLEEFQNINARRVECGEQPESIVDKMLLRLRAYRIKYGEGK